MGNLYPDVISKDARAAKIEHFATQRGRYLMEQTRLWQSRPHRTNMRKSAFAFSLYVLLVPGLSSLAQNTQEDPEIHHDTGPAQCSGKATDCKKPAKFLSKEGDCICFSCEYGTENQKAVCTRNRDEAKALVEKERESEQENRDRDRNPKQIHHP